MERKVGEVVDVEVKFGGRQGARGSGFLWGPGRLSFVVLRGRQGTAYCIRVLWKQVAPRF